MDFRLFNSSQQARLRNLRAEMIHETSVFLTWALAKDRKLPRIPRRRVDQGGFSKLASRADAEELVLRWWTRIWEAKWDPRE